MLRIQRFSFDEAVMIIVACTWVAGPPQKPACAMQLLPATGKHPRRTQLKTAATRNENCLNCMVKALGNQNKLSPKFINA